MNLQPIGTRLLVKPDAADEKVGSFYVPEGNKEKPTKGEVIAVGSGVDGITVGDRIVYGKYRATELKVEGVELVLLEAEDVYARLV